MAATYIYEYEVIGHKPIPLDMLRYDQCYPATEMDSASATQKGPRDTAETVVTLHGPHPPTVARWASFGWNADTGYVKRRVS